MNLQDVVNCWDKAHPRMLHPAREVSEAEYWKTGRQQAAILAKILPPGCDVVDFGCGDGRVTIPLHDLGYTVTGVDGAPSMLRRLADTLLDIPTVLATGPDLPAKLCRQVDAIISLAVLHHHSRADQLDIITGLRDTTKPGGLLILDWPASFHPAERTTWYEVTTWDPEARLNAARELGLEPVQTHHVPWSVWRVNHSTT